MAKRRTQGSKKSKRSNEKKPWHGVTDPGHEPLQDFLARHDKHFESPTEIIAGQPGEVLRRWVAEQLEQNLDEGECGDEWELRWCAHFLERTATWARFTLETSSAMGMENVRTLNGGWALVAGAQMGTSALRLHLIATTFSRLGVVAMQRSALDCMATAAYVLSGSTHEATRWETDGRSISASSRCKVLTRMLRGRYRSAPDCYDVFGWASGAAHLSYSALRGKVASKDVLLMSKYLALCGDVTADFLTGMPMPPLKEPDWSSAPWARQVEVDT